VLAHKVFIAHQFHGPLFGFANGSLGRIRPLPDSGTAPSSQKSASCCFR